MPSSIADRLHSRAVVGWALSTRMMAGYSNLKRIVDLEPHVVKLDIALVRGIEGSRRQQILVRQVVAL